MGCSPLTTSLTEHLWGPSVAEFGGRAAGGFAGGWFAGSLWGSLVGPEGTLIVGLLGGIAGAAGGDNIVKALGG